MIAAGDVDTKTVGTSLGVSGRPGICCLMVEKLASPGSAENAAGRVPAGAQGLSTTGADSHAPLLRRYHLPLALSWNTSQFVLTATVSEVPATGAMIGLPSNTTRLAARALTNICGGASFSATDGGGGVSCCRLKRIASSGTRLTPIPASAALIFSSVSAACAVSMVGKRDDLSTGSVRITVRVATSLCVLNATSTVPSAAVLAPFGVMPIAMRVLRMRRSGHEITCG